MKLINKYFFIPGILCGLSFFASAQRGIKNSIWNVPGIYQVPAYKIISRDSAVGLIYNGLPYQGQTQHVFAYYASPGTIQGNSALDKDLPAIVLVHGGGGRAFKNWAMMWAKKGYAAIAMDLRGNGPDGQHIQDGLVETDHQTPYFKITPALNDQWMYQAVANVILANNLIRSFHGIDTNRVALTGISWGGVITCIVAGLDNRFKVAVPVYGCGYLWKSGRMKKQLDELDENDRHTWIRQYDPSNYVMQAGMPMLFLNDAQDPYFVLRSYMETYHEVKDKNLCIKIHLKHSHHAGWSNEEIYSFVNHYINGTPGLPVVDKPVKRRNKIVARIHSPENISQAFLHYTNDTSSGEKRNWTTMDALIKKNKMIAPVPPGGATIWYLSVIDKRGLKVSSEVQFDKQKSMTK